MHSRPAVWPLSRRDGALVGGVLLVALVLRLGALAAGGDYVPLTDAADYDRIATSIANFEGFGEAVLPPAEGPSALRAPGYPFALSLMYMVFGDHSWDAGRVQNAVIGTVLVGLIGLIAAQLFSRRVAFVAMALAAVHPAMILVGTGLQIEPLLVSLCLAALAAILHYRRDPSRIRWAVVAGLLLGGAVLTRELALLFLPSLLWLAWQAAKRTDRGNRFALAAPLALFLAAFAMVVPWSVRNSIRFDTPVAVTTGAGFGLAGLYNDTSRTSTDAPARWIEPYRDPEMAAILVELEDPTEVTVDEAMRDASIDVVKDHPTYPVKVAFWNTIRLFDFDGGDYSLLIARFLPYSRTLTRLGVLASYGVLALAIAGALRREARGVPVAVWAIPVFIYAFLVLFLPASIRYRASIEPFLVMLASLTVVAVVDRVRPPATAGSR